MIQEIKYNGFTANPSDYECPDGDLAMSVGLVPEDGALKPVLPPKVLFPLGENQKVVFIHQTSAFKYYIVLDTSTNQTFFTDGDTESAQFLQHLYNFPSAVEIYSFNSVGNTLIALTSTGAHYLLWKSMSEGYLYLGTHLPECPISFGLQGEMIRTDSFYISFDSISEGDIWKEFSDNNKTRITDQVLAHVNKFIAENSTDKGKFLFPFLVRYAYRLYDGSLTMHSSPVLMICSSDLAPQVFYNHITGKGSYTDAELYVAGVFHTLDYAVINSADLTELRKWEDIVRSVDVFVSQPIYTYDQNGQCIKFTESENVNSFCVCKHVNQKASTSTYPLRYQQHTFNKMYASTFDPTNLTYPTGRLMIPRVSVDTVKEDIRSCSQFYLLESIKLEQLTTNRTKLNVPEDYLQSLVTREVMTDDYDSHDKLIPQYAFPYNSRLNVANLQKELYNGYNMGALVSFTNGYVSIPGGSDEIFDTTKNYYVFFFIKQDGRDIIVGGESYAMSLYYTPLLFLYYPNINAYKAVIVMYNYFNTCYEVPLEQHSFLNGAFYFAGWDNPPEKGSVPTVSSQADRTIDVPNKIYTSEVNNPFYFPLLGINTVGTGTILGISSAAKALSQGQFGQFPLYAFSTDGVWALEVSDTGTYSAKQPITRDVCINPDSITQIDSAVLFATDRGIMLISGSETICMSDSINSRDLFAVSDLPKADKLVSLFNGSADKSEQITLENVSLLPFRDFLTDCRMIYDYTNQRIIVYNSSVSYAYIYSLKSKAWGMMRSDITDSVAAYPDALAMASGNRLVNFSLSDAEGITALVVTRPFKLGYPDVLKTIDTIIQRGYFQRSHVAQILYGSRDLFNWHVLWSSTDKYLLGFRGSPYKYFRLALICKLDKPESVYGCTVQFTPRFTNRPR